MCITIYVLLFLIFIFIVLNILKTRENFKTDCSYTEITDKILAADGLKKYKQLGKELKNKTLADLKDLCTRKPNVLILIS